MNWDTKWKQINCHHTWYLSSEESYCMKCGARHRLGITSYRTVSLEYLGILLLSCIVAQFLYFHYMIYLYGGILITEPRPYIIFIDIIIGSVAATYIIYRFIKITYPILEGLDGRKRTKTEKQDNN